ncbi:unnamed protein product [Camellia sinensis]
MTHSHTQQTINEALKPWKSIFLPTKLSDTVSSFMKGFLAICIVASISLFSYSTLLTRPRWLSHSDPTFIHSDHTPKLGKVDTFIHSNHAKKLRKLDTFIQSDHAKKLRKLGDQEQTKTNISHIMFCLSGSAKTWNNRRHYTEQWWKPNTTRGFVFLDKKPNPNWLDNTSPLYIVSEDTSRFKYTSPYGSRSAVRIARVVKECFEMGLENVRWFVMGDDDTVFFVENLVAVLGKYDHNEMYYVGGNSESVEQDLIHSYSMAYGGGGFAVSYPLVAELVRILDGCVDRYAALYGSDQKIGGCMSEIGVVVTKELGFHQVDVRGDPYGLLAAHPVAPLVSLHHLDYVQALFPGLTQIDSLKKLIQVYNLDPGRILQQSFCYDLSRNWSISVSWGYTVQLYPTLVLAKELETPFQTFVSWRSWSQEPFTFNTRVMSSDPCERPVIYFLDQVEEVEMGQTRTTYKRFLGESRKECGQEDYVPVLSVEFVTVLAATFQPDMWKKAPRRQCCETVNSTIDGVDGVVYVRVRGCNRWETVTPP